MYSSMKANVIAFKVRKLCLKSVHTQTLSTTIKYAAQLVYKVQCLYTSLAAYLIMEASPCALTSYQYMSSISMHLPE